ncbi:cytochrome P450 [Nocardioides seonyuensis]|uniref:Cytochrome P450 n=1 Tax=Nocardioides seonyuensis TaxID=2518371 RepID=A0A4P7ICS9_9ACTN|nr:cytochrome P450 [Nocardioides seonyuensis]QBX54906.1 cytochrome P450 [Nocardioides seonyuensis]
MAAPVRFDLSDPTFDVTSDVVHAARAQRWWVETNLGWALLRYEESAALLADRRFQQGNAKWPEQNGIYSGRFAGWWKETLLSLEGDDHRRIRRLLMPAFRSKVIAAMRPQFQALAHELVDDFAPRGEVEFISEFAEPYAARILCQLIGLPEADWRQLAHWADDLGKSFGIAIRDDLPRIEAALDGLYGFVDELVARRLEEPADDLVSTLIAASTAEDGRLTREELSVAVVFLAFAGMETTRNQLGLALQTLLQHPDQWRLLGERPELGEQAVEEVMRVNPTVTWVTREAREDVDLGDLHIPKGGIVQVLSHSAGTDPLAMPDPSFDIREVRPPHLGFGSGVHHCLGHFVARTDMAVALPLLAARMPDAVPDGPGRWLPVSGNTGALEFPVRFSPGH